jgi:cation diffusion facilitator CzcD-associated flavoprotein CzcO
MNRESNGYHGSNGYKVDGPRLRIIVVGAGLSGLGVGIQSALAGHSVLILESAKELGEVRKYIFPKPPQKR